MFTILKGLGLFLIPVGMVSAQIPPESQLFVMNELEHVYFDNTGPAGFKLGGIVPCTNYVDSSTGGLPNNALGRQTTAQWIRTAFHDFVTADILAGTGGIDASIGYETHRPENAGPAFDDSLFFFSFFVNAKVSMADLIAVGAAMAMGTCGGAPVALRGGRIDATGPGRQGVPEPETDIRTTLADMARAGFNQEDAIALTVCGHTMGGVHHATFPQVVPESAVGPNNADGRVAWDDTVANFDDNVAMQYVRGESTDPLVVTTNKTVQSDLRLFSSDRNATIRRLAASPEKFQSTCADLFARMLNTVPRGVTLTPVLDPRELKYHNLTLNVDWSGKLTLGGYIRYIEAPGNAPAPKSLTITVIDRFGQRTPTNVVATTDHVDRGNAIYGPVFQYPFAVSFAGSSGLSGIQIGGQRLPLQDNLFVVPTLSSVSPGIAAFNFSEGPHEFTFNITAALRTANPPKSLKGTISFPDISFPISQPGIKNPKIDSSTIVQLNLIGSAGPFALYSVVTKQTMSSFQFFASSIDVENLGGGERAMFFKLFWIISFF